MRKVSTLLRGRELKAVVDRAYPLSASLEAIAYIKDGHAAGKVVIEVVPPYSFAG